MALVKGAVLCFPLSSALWPLVWPSCRRRVTESDQRAVRRSRWRFCTEKYQVTVNECLWDWRGGHLWEINSPSGQKWFIFLRFTFPIVCVCTPSHRGRAGWKCVRGFARACTDTSAVWQNTALPANISGKQLHQAENRNDHKLSVPDLSGAARRGTRK